MEVKPIHLKVLIQKRMTQNRGWKRLVVADQDRKCDRCKDIVPTGEIHYDTAYTDRNKTSRHYVYHRKCWHTKPLLTLNPDGCKVLDDFSKLDLIRNKGDIA